MRQLPVGHLERVALLATRPQGDNGDMANPTRYETEYPDLFAPLSPERRASVSAALSDDRLEGGDIRRDQVELLIRGVTEPLTDDEYRDAVLALVNRRRVATAS